MGTGTAILMILAAAWLVPLAAGSGRLAPAVAAGDAEQEVFCDPRRAPTRGGAAGEGHEAGRREGAAGYEPPRADLVAQEAPRVRICAVAPEFSLRDAQGRRRVSEHVFGARGTLLVFVDATDEAGTSAVLAALRRLAARHACSGVARVLVDASPAWMRGALVDAAGVDVVLRDPGRELESIYLVRPPPVAFVLDERHVVQYWTADEGTARRLESGFVATWLAEVCGGG